MASDIPPGTPAPSERPCKRHEDVVDFEGRRVAHGPCVDREGRTVEHSDYVWPAQRNPVLGWSIVAAAALALALPAVFFLGGVSRASRGAPLLRAVLSPGDTAGPHSLGTFDCAQCHREARSVEDARCERCHDPAISARLTNTAHVFQGTGDLRQALAVPAVDCATCHVDHRGTSARLADVNDRECGTCHRTEPGSWRRLTSLESHPEFALVRARSEQGGGLRWFNHKLHLKKIADKFQKGCEACHVRARNEPAFRPISFTAHCAECHNADLTDSAGSLPATVRTALGPLPPALQAQADADDPVRWRISGITHADPWVLRVVQSLRAVVDPAGFAAERLVLDRQVAQLELLIQHGASVRSGSWAGVEPASLDGAGDVGVQSADDALRESLAVVQRFLQGAQPLIQANADVASAASRLRELVNASSTARGISFPSPAGDVALSPDGNLAESLLRLIDATIARAGADGNDALAARARALRGRVEKIPRAQKSGGAAAQTTEGIDALLRELNRAPDPTTRAEVRGLGYVADIAARRAAGGIDPTAFDLHRQQILALLEQVGRVVARPGAAGLPDDRAAALLAKASALTHRTLGTHYGLPSDLIRVRDAMLRQRQVDRARVDAELEAAGIRLAPPSAPEWDEEPLLRRLTSLKGRLIAIGATAAPAATMSRGDAADSIKALIGQEALDTEANSSAKNRCTLCHDVVPGGLQLAPVRIVGGPLLVKAAFTHEPHVTAGAANCTTCHARITDSTSPRDVNLPGVSSCLTCHAAGRQAARAIGCESCHTYHVRGGRGLMWTP